MHCVPQKVASQAGTMKEPDFRCGLECCHAQDQVCMYGTYAHAACYHQQCWRQAGWSEPIFWHLGGQEVPAAFELCVSQKAALQAIGVESMRLHLRIFKYASSTEGSTVCR